VEFQRFAGNALHGRAAADVAGSPGDQDLRSSK
jgi:hypothetical protein